MPKIPVNFYYGSSEYLNTIPISEGNILYNVTSHQMLVDEDSSRLCYSDKTTVDTKLNDKSNNPISNKVVSAEINALKNTTKSLQSDLTKKGSASSNEVDEVNHKIHTNLLNPTMEDTTVGGIVCTANGDGTYTFNGNTTATANFFPLPVGQGYEMKSGVTYRLCGCPIGGSSTKYELIAEAELGTAFKKQYAHDYGNGVSFTVPQADIDAGYRLRITMSIKSNVENLVFKPMLTTDLSADYDSFVKYSGDGELNQNVAKLNSRVTKTENNITNINNTVTAINKRDEVIGKPTQCGTCGGEPLYRFHGTYYVSSNWGANQTIDIPLSKFGVNLSGNQTCKVIRAFCLLTDENGNQVFLPDRRKSTTGMSVVGVYNNSVRIMTYGTTYNAGCQIEIDLEYTIW